ncbi:MAG: hypothetical protein JKY91_04810 [Emcibacter sp.]|nr:hypothetical protein [Emcibacter sp.]
MGAFYTILILAGTALLFSLIFWAWLYAYGALKNVMRGVDLRGEHWYVNFFPWVAGSVSRNVDETPYASFRVLGVIYIFCFGMVLLIYFLG